MFETSGKGNASRSQQHRTGDQKRMHESRKHTEGASKCAKNESEGHRLSGKLQKTSTMRESLNKNEAPSPLSPKLASISAVNESSDLDYQSDENPFDISSILRAANEGESQTPEAVEYKKASWDVLDYLTEDSPKLAESPKRIVSPKRSASSKVVARSPGKRNMLVKSESQQQYIGYLLITNREIWVPGFASVVYRSGESCYGALRERD